MSQYNISINPLAEFSRSTKAAQKRIIKQQMLPNKLVIPRYQLAKGALKKHFVDVNIYAPIDQAIAALDLRVPVNPRQLTDKKVSIEALRKIARISKPELLSVLKYELIKATIKEIQVHDVNIRIAPDVIIRGTYEDKIVYGAIKFHVCKTKPFDFDQATLVSTLLFEFLSKKIKRKNEMVLPELCLCFDVFGERFVTAPDNIGRQLGIIKTLCEEIKEVWPKSA